MKKNAKHTLLSLTLIFISLLILNFSNTKVHSQSDDNSQNLDEEAIDDDEIEGVDTMTSEGEIIKIDKDQFTIDTNDETLMVELTDDVKVEEDGTVIDKDDLNVGDKVELTMTKDRDEVLAVKVTERKEESDEDKNEIVNGIPNEALIAAVVIATFLVVGLVFAKGSRDGQVKTTTAKVQ